MPTTGNNEMTPALKELSVAGRNDWRTITGPCSNKSHSRHVGAPWGQDSGSCSRTEPDYALVWAQSLSNTTAEDPSDSLCSPRGTENLL